MSRGNGIPKPSPVGNFRWERNHFELIGMGFNKQVFYICDKPHYAHAIRVGYDFNKALALLEKFERLWPCHVLAKEWR